jgi:hypothetical protein
LWKLFGYSFDNNSNNKRQLFPNKNAPYVRRIFEFFNTEVYTQLAIIDILKKEGLKISKQTLNKLLKILFIADYCLIYTT